MKVRCRRRNIPPALILLISSQRDVGRAQRIQRFHNAGADFSRFGMAIDLLLGKDQFAVDPNIKYPAGAWDHVPAFDKSLNFAFFQDVGRQTDGNRRVVSSRAVFNDNVHQSLLHDASPLIQQIYGSIRIP